jgi:hypothetical protein
LSFAVPLYVGEAAVWAERMHWDWGGAGGGI